MGKKYRLSALKEAPVYHPTEDEFADPLRYIASIRAEAEEFGICRIVPPSSFKVPFNQDAASFAFKTRVQTVNELQLRLKKGKNRSFRTEYADFMQSRGQSVTRWPVFGGKKLDLQALYDNVTQRGGFDAVCRAKGWRDMARVMDTPATVTSAAMALRALYQKWLLDFEQHKARQENLSPAGKAKEAAQTKKEQERLAREEKSKELKDRARRDSIGVEEDLIEALFELGNAAAPPPRAKLEMVRPLLSPTARLATPAFPSRLPAKQARETLADPFLDTRPAHPSNSTGPRGGGAAARGAARGLRKLRGNLPRGVHDPLRRMRPRVSPARVDQRPDRNDPNLASPSARRSSPPPRDFFFPMSLFCQHRLAPAAQVPHVLPVTAVG